MADGVNQAQFDALEKKVDTLAASMHAGFAGVDTAFADQRAYTEHAFDQLRTEMHDRFSRVDERFAGVDARLDSVDARLDSVDARLDSVDARLDSVDVRLARIERKLDQFIDTQSKANDLAERRLQRLESRA